MPPPTHHGSAILDIQNQPTANYDLEMAVPGRLSHAA
jgi:hypothetical protein